MMDQSNTLSKTQDSDRNGTLSTHQHKQSRKRCARSAGLTRNATLKEWQEFSNQRYLRLLYHELAEHVPTTEDTHYFRPLYELLNSNQQDPIEAEGKAKSSRRLLKRLFHSSSDQAPQREMIEMGSGNERTALALQRTSNGCSYAQIVTSQVYQGTANASTYNINISKFPSGVLAGETGQKLLMQATCIGKATNRKTNNDEKLSSAASQTNAQSTHESTSQPSIASQGFMSDRYHRTRITHRFREEMNTSNKYPGDTSKPINEIPPAIQLPIYGMKGSMFGLSEEFTQILSSEDGLAKGSGSNSASIADIVSQPAIRDFATHGAPLAQAARSIEATSRSQVKRASRQKQSPVGMRKNLSKSRPQFCTQKQNDNEPMILEAAPAPRLQQAMTFSPSVPAAPPTTPDSTIFTHRHSLSQSPIAKAFSKPSSIISLAAAAEDTLSDTSSVIITTSAQNGVAMRPPMPGPAPTTPLPSLPEGHDASILVTPRSSQLIASTKSSPIGAFTGSPQKLGSSSLARYRFTPDVESPPRNKTPISPIMTNGAIKPECIKSARSSPKRQGSPYSTAYEDVASRIDTTGSTSAANAEKARWNRIESTQRKKAKDLKLARIRSQKADVEDTKPGTSVITSLDKLHQGVVELPSVRDSYDGPIFSNIHQIAYFPRMADPDILIAAQRQRAIILHSNRISPIIFVAEQIPTPPLDQRLLQKTSQNRDSIDEYLQKHCTQPQSNRKSNGQRFQQPVTKRVFPRPAKPASPSSHLSEDVGRKKTHTSSIHSTPVSHQTSLSILSDKPIMNHVPTTFTDPILRPDIKPH